MTTQTTLAYKIKKKPYETVSFYGKKENQPVHDFTNATLRSVSTDKYTPSVKKLVTLSSSESESDSDAENVPKKNTGNCSKRENTSASVTPRRHRKASESDEEHGSTPPKQKKTEISPTTPSTLLDRLNLGISSDPLESLNNLAPRKLFSTEKYRIASKALHGSAPENLPGRESELAQLQDFIKGHLKHETSGSLYVSGPPGTGKTACLSRIMHQPELRSAFKEVYVNCTAMKSAGAIYGKIIQELGLTEPKSAKNSKAIIEKYLTSHHKMLLLILDEIDQLDSKKQSVLYSIFEWPSKKNSKLVLISIANALDLTDRVLPRLQARCELKPKLMHFAPYTKQQIVNIITERLKDVEASEVLSGMAVQLLAGKVAAVSGDVRKALDISRRVIDMAMTQKTTSVLQPTNDNEKNGGSPKKRSAELETAVNIKDVMTVLNGVYGGSQNIKKDENTFPILQKLLLCSLLLILNKGRNKDVTAGKLHEVYRKVCRKRNVDAVDFSEFINVCTLTESCGILKVTRKQNARLSKINLQWDQDEVEAALQDKNMMAEIISDVTCL